MCAASRSTGAANVGEVRSMPVPDGLDGMRIDAGLSRLLGLSRTVVATLAESGRISVDGRGAKVENAGSGFYLGPTIIDEVEDGIAGDGVWLHLSQLKARSIQQSRRRVP